MKNENASPFSETDIFATLPHSEAEDLKTGLFEYIQKCTGHMPTQLWSECLTSDVSSVTYVCTHSTCDGFSIHNACEAQTHDALEGEFGAERILKVAVNYALTPNVNRKTSFIIIFEEGVASSSFLLGLIRTYLIRNFIWFQGLIRDSVVQASLSSNDLSSFFYKCLQSVFISQFNASAGTLFFYEEKSRSLIQGASTGISFQYRNNLKKSDIRYFTDSKSFTSSCFRKNTYLYERAEHPRTLRKNTYGESVSPIHNRLYLPISPIIRPNCKEGQTDPIGIARLININSHTGPKHVTSTQLFLLEFASDVISVLGRQFIRLNNILHDQERSTHGYSTDLLTIAFACRAIQKWIGASKKNPNLDTDTILREIDHRTRSIIATQENMSHQLVIISKQSRNAHYFDAPEDQAPCNTPYKDVFLRLLDAKRGMSSHFNRQELRISANGENTHSEEFKKMPPVNLSVGEFYMIVRNIVENSIKYTRKSEVPQLDISWTTAKGNICYKFRDFGIGIPPKEQRHLGRESFRGHEARRIQLRGNGLGLAVSMAVVESIGGKLEFEQPDDDLGGSVFLLKIPIAKELNK